MFESKFCDICGKPAREYRFGSLLCGDEACLENARSVRGGPAGHKLRVVSLGSVNPVKVRATENALTKTIGQVLISKIDVPSLVSNQPLGFEETFKGAYNRAKAAFESVNSVFGIGIEAGVIEIFEKKLDIHVCVIYDGLNYTVGTSQGFQIPNEVIKKIDEGFECSDAIFELYGFKDAGKKNGLIGYLTDDNITREGLCVEAVTMAMIPRFKGNSKIRF
ncbi:protein of unknown function DUF84 [Methanococcus vannielii SB]|uniref:Probable inosine/xanthosine triphosphatase n=1 Tax=Methanococcus vannielii (strain ATCC 35089 / DSM 1224 / JCM 13029 / OCM 148 / SB) TaxID=406327 RepID=A6US02_METVS|nr:inosine/xanthosine triphosphatase [Methanococcus vannielii]ABR55274.1 protein of unknown function DUF84 [Methanococcus vannielii SB]